MGWMAPLRHQCAKLVFSKNHQEREPSMSEITTVGLDLAKHVFPGGQEFMPLWACRQDGHFSASGRSSTFCVRAVSAAAEPYSAFCGVGATSRLGAGRENRSWGFPARNVLILSDYF